jgi:hypothetical protein
MVSQELFLFSRMPELAEEVVTLSLELWNPRAVSVVPVGKGKCRQTG